jgi:uncharacterized protein YjbI with pentapeptide repeats
MTSMQCEELLQRYQQGQRNFAGSKLTGESLCDADIHGINLAGADLNGANLRHVDMAEANLHNAQLQFADLTTACLRGADLTGANLTGAILRGTNLQDTSLQDAVLDVIRRDLYQYLDHVPQEVEGLLETLRAGRVDGGMYASPCACLAGTCERLRKQHGASKTELQDIVDLRDPNSSRERWFLAIIQGDIPQSSPIAAITAQWLEEWLAARPARMEDASKG